MLIINALHVQKEQIVVVKMGKAKYYLSLFFLRHLLPLTNRFSPLLKLLKKNKTKKSFGG